MGDTRAAQAGLMGLADGDPNARVAQAGAMVLSGVGADVQAAQAGRMALVEVLPFARVAQAGAMILCDAVPCLTRFSQCWVITRTDGEVFGFTSHDQPIPFRGVVCKPCDSLNPSATEAATELGAVGNMELSGIISDAGLNEFDLYAGKFDGAFVEVWEISWDPSDGETPKRIAAGTTGSVSQGRDGFRTEVQGIGAKLQQQALTQVVTAACRWTFGDSRCTKDLAALTVGGVVTGIDPNRERRVFADSALVSSPGFGDNYFALGVVTFTSGPNIGLSSEVKEYDEATGTFVLWQAMPLPIESGHTFDAVPGCDLSRDTCRDRWSNIINFGGFPDVPGEDAITETPDAKY